MEIFLHALEHATIDTLLVFPLLYLAYLLVSYFSHNENNKYTKFLHHSKKAGPMVGAFLGCIPQCGFSSVMSQLYSKKVVTLGTLIAVFIATSDEAIPLMISKPEFIPNMLILIGVKVVLALIFGYLIDGTIALLHRKKKKEILPPENNEIHHHEHHCCAKNIFLDALKHSSLIVLYIFIITLAINLVEGYCGGLEPLQVLFTNNKYIQILIASLVGLIPNCAASVFIVEMYMAGVIEFSALVAGLSAGAGVGLIVLFTTNYKKVWKNLGITVLMYVLAVLCGLVVSPIPMI